MMKAASLAAALALFVVGTAGASEMVQVEYSHMGDALLGFKFVPDQPKAAQIPAVIVVP